VEGARKVIWRCAKAVGAAVLYYSGALWLMRLLAKRQGEALIVTYHAVDGDASQASPAEIDAGLAVTRETLRCQLQHLARRYRIVPLEHVARAVAAGDRSIGGACAVTFDDGFAGFAEHALPALRELGIPATVFIPTDYVDANEELPALRLRRAVWAARGAPHVAEAHKWRGRDAVVAVAEAIERGLSPVQRDALAALAPRRVMGRDVIARLAHGGVAIGSHGGRHDPLPSLPVEAQQAEVAESKTALEDITGGAVTCFCYPHGAADADVAEIVADAGYACACTTEPGAVRAGDDPYLLRRIAADRAASAAPCRRFSPSMFEAHLRWRARRQARPRARPKAAGAPSSAAIPPAAPAFPLKLLALVFAAALLISAPFALRQPDADLAHDGAHYLLLARNIERGLGYAGTTAEHGFLLPDRLPSAESLRSPLYAYCVAAMNSVTPSLPRAGQAVSLLAGALIVCLTVLLALSAGLSRRPALLAGGLAATVPALLLQSRAIGSDQLGCLGAVACLLLLARPGGAATAAGGGALAALAYMARYQNLMLLPLGLVVTGVRRPARAGAVSAGLFAMAFLATSAPYLAHNAKHFGQPFYSATSYFSLEGILEDRGDTRWRHSLPAQPSLLRYAVTAPGEVAKHTVRSAARIFATSMRELLGNAMVVTGVVIGLFALGGAWRRLWPYAAFVAVTAAALALTHYEARYLSAAVPLAMVLAAAGVGYVDRAIARADLPGGVRGRWLWWGLIAVGLLAGLPDAAQRLSLERQSNMRHVTAARQVAPLVRGLTAPNEVIMTDTWVNYYAYYADRPAIAYVYCSKPQMREILRRFNIRIVLMPDEVLPRVETAPGWRVIDSEFERRPITSQPTIWFYQRRDHAAPTQPGASAHQRRDSEPAVGS